MKTELKWAELLDECVNTPGAISAAYSAFWEYSVGNQMAAWSQCKARSIPVGPISSYNGWKAKGRHVSKGQKAIVLCMPITIAKQNEAGEKEAFSAFVWKPNWFVLSQTEGAQFYNDAPIPEWNADKALAALNITQRDFDVTDGNCQGYATADSIAVSPIAAYPHKTRFHELAHIVLGHTKEGTMTDSDITPRNTREVEAESVAYILCSILELPGLESSRAYVQGWLHGEKISDKSASKIFGAANKILEAGK